MPKLELVQPSCNPQTIYDGRGGIFTYIPQEPLVEFSMLYFQPGASRGHHFHPEFTEYFLVVEGQGVMVSCGAPDEPEQVLHMSKGMCSRSPAGVAHTFHAITPVTAIALLTKRWDDSNPPIVRQEMSNPTAVNSPRA